MVLPPNSPSILFIISEDLNAYLFKVLISLRSDTDEHVLFLIFPSAFKHHPLYSSHKGRLTTADIMVLKDVSRSFSYCCSTRTYMAYYPPALALTSWGYFLRDTAPEREKGAEYPLAYYPGARFAKFLKGEAKIYNDNKRMCVHCYDKRGRKACGEVS